MTFGERAPSAEEQRLLDATVEVVGAAYAACIDLQALGEPVIGLVQQVYWDGSDPGQWAPVTQAIPERKATWCAEHGRLDALWVPYELPGMDIRLMPPDVDGATCEAFLASVREADAYELVGWYFLALAHRLHEAFGVPVAVDDLDVGVGVEEQILAQLSPEQREAWAERGWTERDPQPELHPATILHVPTRDGRVAGIYRDGSTLFVTSALGPHCGGGGLDHSVTVLQSAPGIVAGLLPKGASGARVQDLFDRWHDAVTAQGAWLAVLPHEGRGGPPPVEFLGADGSLIERREAEQDDEPWLTISLGTADPAVELDEEALDREERELDALVLSRTTVVPLWPVAGAGAPRLTGWSGDDRRATGVTLSDGTLEVEVRRDDMLDEPARRARNLVESRLDWRLDRRGAARAVVEAELRGLPGSVEGRPETFALLAAEGVWVAVLRDQRQTLEITVAGAGEPPSRLELERASPL